MASADKDFSEDSNFSPKAGTSKLPTDASPDSKCPICLDKFDNIAYLDRCLHRFCFRCVQEWSKNKAECPLCKQPFFSIFHTIRAEDDFKEYILSPSEHRSFASPDGRRFRYRTTLTGERLTGSSPFRRTGSSPESGVLFEGLSSEPASEPARQRDIQQMIRRLASRRRASAEGRYLRQIQEEDMINFRRALYRTGLRIRSIQDGGRYRDISAEFFRRNPACLHRLVPWLKRELTVLFGSRGSLVNIVQHLIMSNVTRHDLESQAFADDLKPFLLNRTEHFLHEFISFARCPFNLEAYDQHANYDCPAPSYDEGSHSDSSIITISPDMAYSQGPDKSLSVTGLGQAPWDDETPGPSYFISEEVHATIASPLAMSESSDEDSAAKSQRTKPQPELQVNADSSDSDSSLDSCVIVGYVKPLAERTPEVVELSSDSEESLQEGKRDDVEKKQPIQGHSWSDSDPSRSFSPHSPTYKEDGGSCRSCLSPAAEKTEPKGDNRHKMKELSPQDMSWSPSPGSDTVCFPWNHGLSRKRRSRSPQSCSRNCQDRHGRRSRREHHSKSQLKKRQSRNRDHSKHRSKRSCKKLRAYDTRDSLKIQRRFRSHESTPSREASRSRSRSKGHGRRRSRSKDSDRYYVRDHCQSRYQWGYAFCSRKMYGDGYESSSRRRTQSTAVYLRQSPSPEYRLRSFIERTDTRSQKGLHERHYYCYERCRSRSRSSNRSRTPSGGTDRMQTEKPGGKRKYKTRHLENAAMETTSPERENDSKKPFSKFSDCHKNEDSLSDNRASSETKRKKKKKKVRSPSVEIVYEGKATDTTKHFKKKKKKHKKKHRKHRTNSSAQSSPVVITIDSDSSKEPESTACDCSITWTSTTQLKGTETESPSSFQGRAGCEGVTRVGVETEGADKKSHFLTRREDSDSDTGNADVRLQETATDQGLISATHSSNTPHSETLTSLVQEAPVAPSSQLPSPRNSFLECPERQPLILRLPKKLVNRSSWFDFPEEKM